MLYVINNSKKLEQQFIQLLCNASKLKRYSNLFCVESILQVILVKGGESSDRHTKPSMMSGSGFG